MKFLVHEYVGDMLQLIPSSGYKRSGWKSGGGGLGEETQAVVGDKCLV